MIGDAAGHDAGIVAELGIDIDRDAVEGDPVADAHADRGDLVFTWAAIRQFGLVRPHHPDTDPARAALGGDVEAGQGTDRPFLEVVDVAPHVLPPGPQVEHDVGHALAGPVIGVLAAAARDMDRKAHRLEQVQRPRLAGRDGAVAAGAGARVAEDHERGGAGVEALADVRAVRLLADGVEALRAHQRLQLAVACAARGLGADPLRVPRRNKDLFGVARRGPEHRERSPDQRRPGH